MTLQTSGALSLSQVQTEFGGYDPIGANEYYAGTGYVPWLSTGTNGDLPEFGTVPVSKFYGSSGAGTPRTTWSIPSNFYVNSSMSCVAIATNGSIYVAALNGNTSSDGYAIYTSTDGISWSRKTTGSVLLNDLAWTGSKFVAIGYSGTCITSTDGSSWISADSSFGTIFGTSSTSTTNAIKVVGNSTRIIALGYGGKCAVSTNGGTTWTSQTGFSTAISTSSNYYSLVTTWTGAEFACFLRNSNTNTIGYDSIFLTSTDGATWTVKANSNNLYIANSGQSPTSLVWANSRYVLLSRPNEGGYVVSSTDGVNWSLCAYPATPSGSASGMVWTGSYFVIVGTQYYSRSTDGITWVSGAYNASSSYVPDQVTKIIYNSSLATIFGISEYGLIAAGSTNNGVTWRRYYNSVIQLNGVGAVNDVAAAGAYFVSCQRYYITQSSDGLDWTYNSAMPGSFKQGYKIAANSTTIVICGSGGILCSTLIGYLSGTTTWTTRASGTINDLNGLVWGNGTFVCVGSGNSGGPTCITSPSGTTWTNRDSSLSTALNTTINSATDVAWSGTYFVCTANTTNFAKSPDGATWTGYSLPSGYSSATRVAAINNIIVIYAAVGNKLARSTDGGASWVDITTNLTSVLGSVSGVSLLRYVNGYFVAAGYFNSGSDSKIAFSTDGSTWVLSSAFSKLFGPSTPRGITYNNKYVVVGGSGACLTSP